MSYWKEWARLSGNYRIHLSELEFKRCNIRAKDIPKHWLLSRIGNSNVIPINMSISSVKTESAREVGRDKPISPKVGVLHFDICKIH